MEYRYKPTTHGRAVIAACMALEKPLKITRVAFGSGRVADDVNLADVHELLAYVSDGAVSERRSEGDRFYLTIQYANAAHKDVKMFLLSEFIVYTEEPETGTETDFLYGALGDYRQPVPAYNPAFPPSVFNFPLELIISDEVGVDVSAPAGIVLHDELIEAFRRHNADPAAHPDIRQTLEDLRQSAGGVPTELITIPAGSWQADADGPGAYRAEVPFEGATDAHIPYVSLDGSSVETANSCGLCDKAEAADGVLRFWADAVPAADIIARAALIGGGSGGCYGLPTATAYTVGGVKVKPGSGLNVAADGSLSVDAASEAEINQMLAGVLDPDNK